jgi:hypothetical protein
MHRSSGDSVQSQQSTPHLSWWEQLVFERVVEDFTECPTCKTPNDSVDVVCKNDSTALTGSRLTLRRKTIIINVLKFAALAVALAVGYLNWMWPTYAFGGIVAVVFFSLFLRNHSMTLRYFLVIAIITLIAAFAWKVVNPEGRFSSEAAWIVVVGLLAQEVFFLLSYSLPPRRDAREEWLKNRRVDIGLGTLTWIAFLLTVSVLFVMAFVSSWLIPQWIRPATFGVLMLQLGRLAFGTALVTALVSSTIYSLQAPPFVVPNRWKYRRILEPLKPRCLHYEPGPSSSWHLRITETMKSLAISSANNVLKLLATSYNYFVVGFIENLARNAVKIANSLRRFAIKTALHLRRCMHRCIQISKWSAQWAFHVGLRYGELFLIPPISMFACALLLYGVSEDFFGYVHQGSTWLPVYLTLKVLGATALFALALSLLLHLRFFTFFEKILNALSVFGTSAFLFFLLIAWGLGVVGMMTNGPYRIGWVTISSTLLLVSVFAVARRRATEPMDDSHDSEQASLT